MSPEHNHCWFLIVLADGTCVVRCSIGAEKFKPEEQVTRWFGIVPERFENVR